MVETLSVPRVSRPVELPDDVPSLFGEAAWDMGGLYLDFEAPEVTNHDAVLLGTGEMVWYHKKMGRFLDCIPASTLCSALRDVLPDDFREEIPGVEVSGYRIRQSKDKENTIHNVLIGSLRALNCERERRKCLNVVAGYIGLGAVGLSRANNYCPVVKLAEVSRGTIKEGFVEEFSERVGAIVVTVGGGTIEEVELPIFSQRA
jgi:hypothetical protein